MTARSLSFRHEARVAQDYFLRDLRSAQRFAPNNGTGGASAGLLPIRLQRIASRR